MKNSFLCHMYCVKERNNMWQPPKIYVNAFVQLTVIKSYISSLLEMNQRKHEHVKVTHRPQISVIIPTPSWQPTVSLFICYIILCWDVTSPYTLYLRIYSLMWVSILRHDERLISNWHLVRHVTRESLGSTCNQAGMNQVKQTRLDPSERM